MHGSERARCAYGRGQRLGGGLGNSIGEVSAIRLMSRERLQAGPAGLAAGLRYTTQQPATEKQTALLRKLGMATRTGLTKGEAAELLAAVLGDWD